MLSALNALPILLAARDRPNNATMGHVLNE